MQFCTVVIQACCLNSYLFVLNYNECSEDMAKVTSKITTDLTPYEASILLNIYFIILFNVKVSFDIFEKRTEIQSHCSNHIGG